MSLSDSIASDYTLIDGVETVTFTPCNPAGAPVAGVQALRRVTQQLAIAASAGALPCEPHDVVWHVWTVTLAGAVPKNGDTLTDAVGVVWIVQSLAEETLGTRIRAKCRREV